MRRAERHLGVVLQRGVRGRCPACGKGRLLRNYLTLNAECANCVKISLVVRPPISHPTSSNAGQKGAPR